MTAFRIVTIALLSFIAGLVLCFGAIGLSQRQAAAAPPGQPATGLSVAALAAPAGNSVGPGGSFVTNVYKSASPAVVHITNRMEQHVFDMFRGPQTVPSEAVGSGVIVDPAGYIVTNSHVVQAEDSNQLTVVLSDQSSYSARIVGNDPSTDLALLKIEPKKSLPVAPLGDSDNVDIGEWVVAIGNPRGYDWTVTAGVVSAKNRSGPAWQKQDNFGNVIAGPTITGLIQTDAAINPGNSGGPLLNARGEVIGINERIITSSQGSEGIGLAIPSNTAKGVIAQLKQYGHVQRSWLGLNVLLEISPESAAYYNFPVKRGLLIGNIVQDSPAVKAGIVQGRSSNAGYQFDIITGIDGQTVKTQQDLLNIVRNRKPGQAVKVHLYRVRNGRTSESDVNVTLSAVPAEADMSGYI